MHETLTYLLLSILLIASAHIWSAIKSGCFYGKGTADYKNPLKKYIQNLHWVQTPFWYSLFGALFFMVLAIARLYSQKPFLQAIADNTYLTCLLAAYLIAQGTSAACGVFYQGFINLGAGKPFINPNEPSKFEIANPFNYTSVWLPKFWHGKNRVWIACIGLLMVIVGVYLILH